MINLSEKEGSEFAWKTQSYLSEHIRFADTKAELVIGWSSALVGLLAAAKFHQSFGLSLAGVVSLVGFALLILAFACAVWVVCPRLTGRRLQGFIFWKSILAHRSKEQFVAEFGTASSNELILQLGGHLFDLARVCNAKYFWVSVSIWLAFLGSSISGIMYLIQAQ